MCFLATVKETDRLREMMKAHGGTMRFWKTVDRERCSTGARSYVKTPLTYKAGTVVHALTKNATPVRRRKHLQRDRRMSSGVYVRRGKPFLSLHYISPHYMVLRVEARADDLIGSGRVYNGRLVACFTKVKVLT